MSVSKTGALYYIKKYVLSIGYVQNLLRECYKRQWKKANAHNFTKPTSYYPIDKIMIGKGSYGKIHILSAKQERYLRIGNYCSIADEVTFILSTDHPLTHLSTYPFKAMYMGEQEATAKGDIIVGDDVWIGYRVVILSGIKIERGAVIAAGAVVTKDVPPYAIVAGVPARVIKYRFTQDVINKLMTMDYNKLMPENIMSDIDGLYCDINENNVDSIVGKLNDL